MNAIFMPEAQLQQHFDQAANCLASEGYASMLHCHQTFYRQHAQRLPDYRYFADVNQRGVQPIDCPYIALSYTTLYAAEHYSRMRCMFDLSCDALHEHLYRQHALRVVDYGCGQGLATLALLDYLADIYPTCHFALEIVLIEPSDLARQWAESLIQLRAEQLGIFVIIRGHAVHFDQLDEAEIGTTDLPILHLLSNVLDMASSRHFNVRRLAQHIQSMASRHLLIAVSPDFPSGKPGFERLVAHLNSPRAVVPLTSLVLDDDELIAPRFSLYTHRKDSPVRAMGMALTFEGLTDLPF